MFVRANPLPSAPKWENSPIGSHKTSLWKKAGRVFTPIILGARFVIANPLTIGCTLVNSARYIANGTKELFGVAKDDYLLGPARLISGVSVMMRVNNIAHSIIDFVKGGHNDKADSLLSMVSDLGTIGDAVSTFAQGLESVGAVAAKSILWATPLLIVSMGLEAAGLVLGIKGIVETYLLSHKLFKDKNPKEYTIDDYQEKVNYLEERRVKERLLDRKFFRVDREQLGDRLLDIELEAKRKINSENPLEKEQGENLIRRTMKTLKGRLTTRIISYAVGVVAAATCLVGLSILLAVPGMQPLGFALLAVGVVVSLARCGADFALDYRFKKAMKLAKMAEDDSKFPGFPKAKKKKKKKINEAFKLEYKPLKDKNIKQNKLTKIKKMYDDFNNKISHVTSNLLARRPKWFSDEKVPEAA